MTRLSEISERLKAGTLCLECGLDWTSANHCPDYACWQTRAEDVELKLSAAQKEINTLVAAVGEHITVRSELRDALREAHEAVKVADDIVTMYGVLTCAKAREMWEPHWVAHLAATKPATPRHEP